MEKRFVAPAPKRRNSIWKRIYKARWGYITLLPLLIYLAVFGYVPMYGITLAFKKYSIRAGILGSPWVGFKNFERLFDSSIFWRSVRNTLIMSAMSLFLSFPVPIIFALMINEVQSSKVKRVVQTISYMPHFISWVVVSSMLVELLSPTRGTINYIITLFGGEPIYFLAEAKWFRWIILFSGIWKGVGWGSIIYLASIAGISQEQYEAAWIDGATRFKCMIYITIPALMPIISIQLISSVSGILAGNFDQVYNLYNGITMETGDNISTYAYRVGLEGKVDYSLSTAISLFQNGIGCLLLIFTNYATNKLSGGESGLW